MKTLFGLDKLPLGLPGSSVTLGVFDGLHRGHQAVIGRLLLMGRAHKVPTVAVTFRQHPGHTLNRRPAPLLTSLRYRLKLLERQGLDLCVVLDFTQELAEMPAEEFVRNVFVSGLKAKAVVVGFDCRFGRDREGDVAFLARQGEQFGFEVQSVGPVEAAGQKISSTAIRRLVADGDFEAARAMLGRPYSVLGKVVGGSHRGTGLGFPTANLDLRGVVVPPEGVYVAGALVGTDEHQCLVSIGDRPTFADEAGKVVVEVYLLDFERQIYGQDVEVQLLGRIRGQRKYASSEELAGQMQRDLQYARRYFAGDLEG